MTRRLRQAAETLALMTAVAAIIGVATTLGASLAMVLAGL